MNQAELSKILQGEPAFRVKQLFEFLYQDRQKALTSINDCSVLPQKLRSRLSCEYELFSSTVDKVVIDSDGSKKFRLKLHDGNFIESVLLVDKSKRKTLCLSSQVGCRMQCAFCRTGEMGFKRNLTTGEILEQLKWIEVSEGRVDNLVFMGMGEPLDNISNLLSTIALLVDERAFHLSHRRITVSTSGDLAGLRWLACSGNGIRLAVSLSSAIEEKRKTLMPITNRYPVKALQKTLQEYQKVSDDKRITLEYVLLEGVNMGEEDLQALIRFASPLKVLVNLIPYNPCPSLPFRRPSEKLCLQFKEALLKKGLNATLRYSKGKEILGACGQLANEKN